MDPYVRHPDVNPGPLTHGGCKMSEPAGIADPISHLLCSFICMVCDDLALRGQPLLEADK